jgi:hypothetical protein
MKVYSILYDHHGKPRFQLPCAGYAVDPDTGDFVYLELVGAPQPVNAHWANLRRNWHTTGLAATYIKLYDENSKSTIVAIVPKEKRHYGSKGQHHFCMHEGFDKMHLDYLFDGDETEPSPMFVPALKQFIDVPFLSRWTEKLWTEAISNEIITPLKGTIPAWKLNKSADDWQNLVITLRQQGELPHG